MYICFHPIFWSPFSIDVKGVESYVKNSKRGDIIGDMRRECCDRKFCKFWNMTFPSTKRGDCWKNE